MPTYGRQVLFTTGSDFQVLASGDAIWHPIGATIDWATVAAVSGADVTYGDGTIVKIGAKGIPYGTVLCRVTTTEVQTITLTNATGGTFPVTGNNLTVSGLAFNVAAADLQTAIRSLGGVYYNAVVTGSAGGPYSVTYTSASGDVPALTTSNAALTGSSPTIAVTTPTAGLAAGGKWAPYDSGASNGLQTLSRGNCGILNRSVLELGYAGIVPVASDITSLIEGGLVWRERLKVGGASQPSFANVEAALPMLRYVQQ